MSVWSLKSIVALALAGLLLAACTEEGEGPTSTPPEQEAASRTLQGEVRFGRFSSFEASKLIKCGGEGFGRDFIGAAEINPPEGESYLDYTVRALAIELSNAGVKIVDSKGADSGPSSSSISPIALTGVVDRFSNMMEGIWLIGLLVRSTNGEAVGLNVIFRFAKHDAQAGMCTEYAKAAAPAVRSAVRALVNLPEFPALLEMPPDASLEANVGANSEQEKLESKLRRIGGNWIPELAIIEILENTQLIKVAEYKGHVEQNGTWNDSILTKSYTNKHSSLISILPYSVDAAVNSFKKRYRPFYNPTAILPGVEALLLVYDNETNRYQVVIDGPDRVK